MFNLIFYIILLSSFAYCNEDETGARLLLSKQILNKYLVENMDIIVKYNIYNVGNSAAFDIELTDRGFQSGVFTVVCGKLSAKITKMAPQTNFTHIVVVRPNKYGYYNFTAAEISYKANEDSRTMQHTLSNEPGKGTILSLKDFKKTFSSHGLDWIAFAVMIFPSLAIPFGLWYNSKRKYEQLNTGKIKKRH